MLKINNDLTFNMYLKGKHYKSLRYIDWYDGGDPVKTQAFREWFSSQGKKVYEEYYGYIDGWSWAKDNNYILCPNCQMMCNQFNCLI